MESTDFGLPPNSPYLSEFASLLRRATTEARERERNLLEYENHDLIIQRYVIRVCTMWSTRGILKSNAGVAGPGASGHAEDPSCCFLSRNRALDEKQCILRELEAARKEVEDLRSRSEAERREHEAHAQALEAQLANQAAAHRDQLASKDQSIRELKGEQRMRDTEAW